jgi:hypothetical protein
MSSYFINMVLRSQARRPRYIQKSKSKMLLVSAVKKVTFLQFMTIF